MQACPLGPDARRRRSSCLDRYQSGELDTVTRERSVVQAPQAQVRALSSAAVASASLESLRYAIRSAAMGTATQAGPSSAGREDHYIPAALLGRFGTSSTSGKARRSKISVRFRDEPGAVEIK